MSLSIKLDGTSRSHIFVPGERVSGRVILRCSKEENVSAITIRFRGKVKTVVGDHDNHTNTGRHVLFEHQKNLFEGPYTLPGPDTHEWPFEFTFPEQITQPIKGVYEKSRQFGGLELPQLLPPSVYSYENGHLGTGITYMVVAKIPKSFVDLKAKHALQFSPFRLEARPEPCPETRQQKFLNHQFRIGDDGVPRSLTSKETIRDAFKTSKETRTIQFSVSVEAPTVIVLGERVPFHITVNSTFQDEARPPFSLQGFRACVHGVSRIRAPGSFGDHTSFVENEYHVEANVKSKLGVELNSPKPLGGIMLDPKKLAPSFMSFSIVRSYYLSLHVMLCCCSKEFEVKMKFPAVILLSSKLYQLSNDLTASIGEGMNQLSLTEREDEIAPAYEQASTLGRAAGQPPAYEPERSVLPLEKPMGWSAQ